MAYNNCFRGRTLAVINDFSLDERLFLFEKARELKRLLTTGKAALQDPFRLNDQDLGVYEVFLEDSTRTKESFRNAAKFHRVKLSELDTGHSSINKKESYADTFNNLTGYGNSIFIVRSKLEGVCRWLEKAGSEYAKRNGLQWAPSFINAGDGKHEHPTQELLDEFTFLEDNGWDRTKLHIALVGDLFHGRTVHSKVDGLTVFENVSVDLVAPGELAMPADCISRMKENGFALREFDSIDSYVSGGDVASKWYFTRPQLERMGEDILKRQDELRACITFKKQYLSAVPEGTFFYHPLPRHKEHPTIPTFLDSTSLNHWEQQSANGRIVRIILLGLIGGALGDTFQGSPPGEPDFSDDFIEEIELSANGSGKEYAEGVKPISKGIVIDHILRGEQEKEIRDHLPQIIKVLKLYGKGGEWVSDSRDNPGIHKGIIFRPGHPPLDEHDIKKLAAIAPGCTINVIDQKRVVKKVRLTIPPRIYGFNEISCKNNNCISHPDHFEGVPAEFHRTQGDRFICKYCETMHCFKEIWT